MENLACPVLSDLGEVRYYRLCRFALVEALRMLALKPGASVLVPAFICRDLLAAIYAVGAVPVFFQVNRRLAPSDLPTTWPVADAVFAVNYFGFPQDLAPFLAYCDRTGAVLIEDNAHGFLSRDASGIALGARGDLGLFSMRKTLISPDGAALAVNRYSLLDKTPSQLPFSDGRLPISFWVKKFLSFVQRKLGIPALAWMQSVVRCLRYVRTGHAITPLANENEFELPSNPAPHRYLRQVLANVDEAAESRRRINLFEMFRVELADLGIQPVFDGLPLHTVPYGYPFYATDDDAAKVTRISRAMGLDCVRWPDLPAAVAPAAPDHYKTLWMINFLW